MKIMITLCLVLLTACSTNHKESSRSLLLSRNCNSDFARRSGKGIVQEDKKINNVTFDQCSSLNNTSGPQLQTKAVEVKMSVTGSKLYKCEVDTQARSFAVSNKDIVLARERLVEECKKFSPGYRCTKIKCFEI